MLRLVLTFLAWSAVGTGFYFLVAKWAVIPYGILTLLALLIWAATRKNRRV